MAVIPGSTPHTESTRKLHDALGSGWYEFAAKFGFNCMAFVSSEDVTVYNPVSLSSGYNDFYDFLRAVETGWVARVTEVKRYERNPEEESDIIR